MTGDLEVYCPECGKTFSSEKAMLEHYDEQHNDVASEEEKMAGVDSEADHAKLERKPADCEYLTCGTLCSAQDSNDCKKNPNTCCNFCFLLGSCEDSCEHLEDGQGTSSKVNALVKLLSRKGMVFTYYCCSCGAPLKIGFNQEILKICPNCGYDLTAINLAKLISQKFL
jgi:hypothetical protein